MYQQVTVLGYLGKDPEVRQTGSGTSVANFSIAASERWKDKQGEQQERTEWFSAVAFGRTAEIAEEFLHKGSLVLVTGRLRTEKWQDKEGNDRYTTKLNVDSLKLMPRGGSREESEEREERPARQERSSGRAPARETASKPQDDFDDDIPF